MRNYASTEEGGYKYNGENDIIFEVEVCTPFHYLALVVVVHGRYILSTSGYTKYGFSGFQSYRSTYVKLQIGKYHFLEMWELC